MSSSVTPFRELGLAMASKRNLLLPWRLLWLVCGRVVRLQLVLLLALEVPPSSIRRPSPFGPSFLFLFVKVKKLTSPGLEPLMTSLSGSKLGPLDYASQSSFEVGCVLKGA